VAKLALQTITGNGEVTMIAASIDGDSVPNPLGRSILRVNNGGVSNITVSVEAQVPCDQGEYHDLEIIVEAGDTIDIVLDKRLTSLTTGNVDIEYSDVTDVLVGAYQIAYRS
jgi:hypothetical protein